MSLRLEVCLNRESERAIFTAFPSRDVMVNKKVGTQGKLEKLG